MGGDEVAGDADGIAPAGFAEPDADGTLTGRGAGTEAGAGTTAGAGTFWGVDTGLGPAGTLVLVAVLGGT